MEKTLRIPFFLSLFVSYFLSVSRFANKRLRALKRRIRLYIPMISGVPPSNNFFCNFNIKYDVKYEEFEYAVKIN